MEATTYKKYNKFCPSMYGDVECMFGGEKSCKKNHSEKEFEEMKARYGEKPCFTFMNTGKCPTKHCFYSHDQSKPPIKEKTQEEKDELKKQLCTAVFKGETCRYADNCLKSHNLRDFVKTDHTYKTIECDYNGRCTKTILCTYSHASDQSNRYIMAIKKENEELYSKNLPTKKTSMPEEEKKDVSAKNEPSSSKQEKVKWAEMSYEEEEKTEATTKSAGSNRTNVESAKPAKKTVSSNLGAPLVARTASRNIEDVTKTKVAEVAKNTNVITTAVTVATVVNDPSHVLKMMRAVLNSNMSEEEKAHAIELIMLPRKQ
jgi:hypothetical protein